MAKTEKKNISFEWEGINRTGQNNEGSIEARSLTIAKVELQKQGIVVKKIKKKRTSWLRSKGKKIKPLDVTVFTRQIATMIQAGIPLIQSFDIVAKGQTHVKMKELILAIKKDVETGLTLSEVLRKYPNYFNDLFCNLVEAGEKSGSLDIMLDKIATYKEKIETIKKKIKKALAYPMAVIAVAFLVTSGLLIFVVPQFESLFKGFGADLPIMTQVVVNMSRFFQSYWYLILAVVVGIIYGINDAIKHSPMVAHQIDYYLLKILVVGTILNKASIARFSRTLAITFAAGLPLVDALKSVAGATGNNLFAEATDKIREDVSNGQPMNVSMTQTNMFPNMVVQMIAIGEESGSLEKMLGKVADFYEEAVDNDVDALSSLIEPIIMVILGILVGGLVVAMYLPIFKLGSVV